MHYRIRLFILLNFIVFQFNSSAQEKEGIIYDLDCFNHDNSTTFLNITGEIIEDFSDRFNKEVSIEDEHQLGEQFLEYFKKNSKINTNKKYLNRLEIILNRLVPQIRNKKGFRYEIYYLDTTLLNAFTVGGKIFLTKQMIEFCKNDDQLACIIGHEIAHNELRHIAKVIQYQRLFNDWFGKSIGSIAFTIGKFISNPFNQKDEAYSDMRGMDIAKAAGFNICSNKNLWERMQVEQGEKQNIFITFSSSHPYSGTRAQCVQDHILKNYQIRCTE